MLHVNVRPSHDMVRYNLTQPCSHWCGVLKIWCSTRHASCRRQLLYTNILYRTSWQLCFEVGCNFWDGLNGSSKFKECLIPGL